MNVVIEESFDEFYNEVRTEGDRAVCCTTLTGIPATPDLISGWTSAEETGYSAADDEERQSEIYGDVYTRYVWDVDRPTAKFDVEIDDSDSSVDVAATSTNLDLLHIQMLDWIPVDEGDPDESSGDPGKGAKYSDKRPMKVVMEDNSPFDILEDITKVSGIAVQPLNNKLGFKARPNVPHELNLGYGYDSNASYFSNYPTRYSGEAVYCTASFLHDVRPRIVTKADSARPISDGVFVEQIESAKLWVQREARLDVNPSTLTSMLAPVNAIVRNDTNSMLPEHNGKRARYNTKRYRASIRYEGLALWHRDTIGRLLKFTNDGYGLTDAAPIISSVNWSFSENAVVTQLKAGYSQ
jgi:hypothetical protein